MYKFKVGDEILVTAGRDKGKKGKVEKVLKEEHMIVAGGINIYKRHLKATRNRSSGIYENTRPMTVANVAVVCPKCNKPTRIGFETEGNKKFRVCKKCKGRLS